MAVLHASLSLRARSSDEIEVRPEASRNIGQRASLTTSFCRSMLGDYASNDVDADLCHAFHGSGQPCVPRVIPPRDQ